MLDIFYILFLLLFSLNIYSFPLTPNPKVSPGSLCTIHDPDFDGFRYLESIPHCKRNVSTKLKKKVCKRDGVTDRRNYTVDHIYPLSLGGSNHSDNLWCQHKSIYTGHLEYDIYKKVRDGEMKIEEARKIIYNKKFYPNFFKIKSAHSSTVF